MAELLRGILKNNLALNGHYELPGGLILQWGSVNIGGGVASTGTNTFDFPVEFPSALFVLIPVDYSSAVESACLITVGNATTKKTAQINWRNPAGAVSAVIPGTIWWIALGK